MGEWLRSMVIVTVLALAVWVFAEAESLSAREVNTRVEFVVSNANRDLMRARVDREFAGQVQLELRGPRSALDRVQRALDEVIVLTPNSTGVATDGPFTIYLADYLQNLEVVDEANVEVVSARPPTLTGELVRLETVEDVPVDVLTRGLDLEAAPTVSPETTRVRVPASIAEQAERELRVLARLAVEEVEALPAGEPRSLPAALELPEPWRSMTDVQLLGPQTAAVGLTIRSTRVVASVEATLWTTVPSAQAGAFELAVDLGDRVFDVEVAGPQDAVSRIESGELPVVAVVAILPDELLENSLSKEIRWFVREGGGLRSLPPGVEVRSERQSVTVTITPADDA